jgi:hypothetical protein
LRLRPRGRGEIRFHRLAPAGVLCCGKHVLTI